MAQPELVVWFGVAVVLAPVDGTAIVVAGNVVVAAIIFQWNFQVLVWGFSQQYRLLRKIRKFDKNYAFLQIKILDVLMTFFFLIVFDISSNLIHTLADNVSFEAFFWICCVGNGANETVWVNNRVAALDHISITHLFALLIIGVFIVFNIETKLIWWISL